jgi:hypothetical protein
MVEERSVERERHIRDARGEKQRVEVKAQTG